MARLRPTLFIILEFTILALASYPFYQGVLPKAHAARLNLSLIANVNGWNYTQPSGKNPTITVHDTDDVNILLTTADTQNHRFYIDKDRNGLPDCNFQDYCSWIFNSTYPLTYGWVSGILPRGTYNYYDSYNQATTNGTLIVQAGPYPVNADVFLTATTQGWNYSKPSGTNPTITVYDGQNVVIHLNTTDPPGTQHMFYVDFDRNGVPDCSTQDMCSGVFDSTVNWIGVSWIGGSVADGIYHYYDSYYPTVSNGTFIVRAYTPTPDYSVSASPSYLTIQQGTSQTSTLTVSSQNNYTGTISLVANPTGVTATLKPTSVSVPKNGIATSTLNVTAPSSLSPGNYQVMITATNGTTQRSSPVNVQVTAPDFSLTTNTNALNITQGSSSATTITITSRDGFSGKVSLTDQITPSGPTTSQNPPTVNLVAGGRQISNLTISTIPTTPAGSYTITVTGNSTSTNGPLTHSITLTVNVNPLPVSLPTNNAWASTFLFEVLAGIIGAVSTAVILAKHRSNRKRSETSNDQEKLT